MSGLAEYIPGIAPSERAFSTFLNKMRFDLFKTLTQTLGRDGTVTQHEAKALAFYVNAATGRGSLGKHDLALPLLNTLFFSPRLQASRLQLLVGAPLYRGSWRTRKLIAMEYARFAIGAATVIALSSLAGRPPEDDPRSADFGKIVIGRTRIDPWGGLVQWVTLVARLTSGQTKQQSGKIVPIRGDKVPYRGNRGWDVATRFMRSKLAPVFGSAVNFITGEDYIGRPATVLGEAQNLTTPMSGTDIYRAIRAHGLPSGIAMGILAILGVGLNTYEVRTPKAKTAKLSTVEF